MYSVLKRTHFRLYRYYYSCAVCYIILCSSLTTGLILIWHLLTFNVVHCLLTHIVNSTFNNRISWIFIFSTVSFINFKICMQCSSWLVTYRFKTPRLLTNNRLHARPPTPPHRRWGTNRLLTTSKTGIVSQSAHTTDCPFSSPGIMTTRCLAVTGGGSVGNCDRLTQTSWLLGI